MARNYVRCPVCDATSMKLYSEMGGLQTRQCRNGHVFEYDKWMADRIMWAPDAIGSLKKVKNEHSRS